MLALLSPAVTPAPPPTPALVAFVEQYKPLLPIPLIAAIGVLLWLFFRKTWRELDDDSFAARTEMHARGEVDRRPFVALVLIALVLTLQEYYGGRVFFEQAIAARLKALELEHPAIKYGRYTELYGYGWWALTRIFGYSAPLVLWKFFFRRDSVLDFGLRTKGFFDHAWIYMLFLAVVLPAMFLVAQNPDFGTYYPFYKQTSRSWFDLLAWWAMYLGQFFALELFFRGFFLGALRRSFGSGAIFAMALPYCMIHYGKPYLEACGAIIAGIALGSLSMKTKSIYQGFFVHITVAVLMDWLSLRNRKATPISFWPPDVAPPPGATLDAQRESLARTVEQSAAGIALVFFLLLVVMTLRSYRMRTGKAWPWLRPAALGAPSTPSSDAPSLGSVDHDT